VKRKKATVFSEEDRKYAGKPLFMELAAVGLEPELNSVPVPCFTNDACAVEIPNSATQKF
jgi:hypothetical protein